MTQHLILERQINEIKELAVSLLTGSNNHTLEAVLQTQKLTPQAAKVVADQIQINKDAAKLISDTTSEAVVDNLLNLYTEQNN